MLPDAALQEILRRPDTLVFASNLSALPHLLEHPASSTRQADGHVTFYGSHGRRVLATDPDGNPLHECEWGVVEGTLRLLRARLHLDWGAWVGVIPSGLVNRTTLDLSRKPGWERLLADDLRGMAAQAMQVPLEEVRFFYNDQDVTIDTKGTATIRHRKDALFVLPDGTFDRKQFMACMGAMHWEDIDFLPVVELFLSLLPGTGSTMFELIRGLYDDQNRDRAMPRPLRYRGIPTYPSDAAYRLFSGSFRPEVPGGGDPFPVFMDPPRSHFVTWLPSPDAPRRYFDVTHNVCVTIKGQRVVKATCWNDPKGLSYQPWGPRGIATCQRSLALDGKHLVLTDRGTRRLVPLNSRWGKVTEPQSVRIDQSAGDWTSVFEGHAPAVSPEEAFGAVLLYPDDDREIAELSTQPFVADYLQDLIDQDGVLAARVRRAGQVLISGFDATITTCMGGPSTRACTVLYDHPAFAQRQAQIWWNICAGLQQSASSSHVRMKPRNHSNEVDSHRKFDLLYEWTPFDLYDQPDAEKKRVEWWTGLLAPEAFAFVVGSPSIADGCRAAGVQIQAITPLNQLPTFHMHQTILPRARLKPGAMLYQIAKR